MRYVPGLLVGVGVRFAAADVPVRLAVPVPLTGVAAAVESGTAAAVQAGAAVGSGVDAGLAAGRAVGRTGRVGVGAAAGLGCSFALAWQVPESVVWTVPLGLAAASDALAFESVVFSTTAVTGLAVSAQVVSLVVDPFAVRPDQAALMAAERHVSYSPDLIFDEPDYIPSSIIIWGGEDLTKRAAVAVAAGVSIRQYQPPERRAAAAAGWQAPEFVADGAGVDYVLGVLVPGGAPDANSKKVHVIMNIVNCQLLPSLEPLALADIKIDLDVDSHSWKLSAVALNAATAALLRPDASGRKELQVTINGHVWVFFVSKTSEARSVDGNKLSRRWAVTGYSRTQYLADPYAPKRTRSIGTTTAIQAATDELTGTGFTLLWNVSDLPDWTMPNASFSYQSLAPIQVIRKLATVAGAVVVPGMAADQIRVRPRYPVLPWYLIAAEADKTIHESQILSESHEDQPGVLYNAVFVSGESEGGALNVVRQGTAGDNPAADVSDSWITDQPCNLNRGQQELAGSGDRVMHSLELPLPETGAQPGLLLPGDVVEVVHDDSSRDYRGFVESVAISVPGRGGARVVQTVTIDQPSGWQGAA
tara:strand:- start:467 stop:2233 length:1767 start_codon:yes stop_codon:yes gene_type:complete